MFGSMGGDQSTGELICVALKRAGTRHLFTLNGGHIWPILLGAVEQEIRLLGVRHEQTAAFAAEGWSKLTRECGVCAVTAGPGVTNTISALAGARANDSPMLTIGGRSPLSTEGTGSIQELDHLPVVSSLTKYARTVRAPEEVYGSLTAAFQAASSRRPGPVFVDVPVDVFFGSAGVPDDPVLRHDPGEGPDLEEVRRASAILRGARRPAIVAGSGVWWAHAEAELGHLAHSGGGIPAVLNGLARGILEPEDPLCASRGRKVALGEADVILAVGVPLDFRLGFGRPPVIPDEAKLIYVDFDDRRRHRPGVAALDGDIRRSLAALGEAAEQVRPASGWLEKVRVATEQARRADEGLAASSSRPIHPARVVAEVGKRLDPDAVVIGDGGDFVSFMGRMLESRRPGCFLDPGPFGCLGSGPGYAMAARLAHPGRQVVIFNGDGAFGFSALDYETLVRERLPVVAVIGNNGIWATEKHPMRRLLGSDVAAELRPGVRYDQLVAALGGWGELVEDPEEVGPAFERALAAGVPAVINVITDPEAEYPRSAVLL